MEHPGVAVFIILLMFAMAYTGYMRAEAVKADRAFRFGASAYLGMVLITGLYKEIGFVLYPEHAAIFKSMDETIFALAAFLFVAWIVGVTVQDCCMRRAKRTA